MSNDTYEENYVKLAKEIEGVNIQDLAVVAKAIFDVASSNRFYSQMYAALYARLVSDFDGMRDVFESNIERFLGLFENIHYVNPDIDYDAFCQVNTDNETRKAMSSFFLNLTKTKCMSESQLVGISNQLLLLTLKTIPLADRKNEADEMIENICLLFDYGIFDRTHVANAQLDTHPDAHSFFEHLVRLSKQPPKVFPSLTSKSTFLLLDTVEASFLR